MKIDLTTQGLQSHEPVKSGRSSPPEARRADAKVENQDAAQLSLGRARIAALQKASSVDAEIRTDRVEALRRVIADGRYQVEPDQVAEAMMSELLARNGLAR